MKVISICNIKGGVGKSTVAINLAYELSKFANTLIIDNDSQSNVTQVLLPDEVFEETLYNIYTNKELEFTDVIYQVQERLYVVPNEIKSAKLDRELVSAYNRERILKNKLDTLPKNFFSFVIIDNTPALNITLENSIVASDYHLIVVDNSSSSLQGYNMIMEMVNELRSQRISESTLLGVLRNRFDKKANFTKAFNETLEESLGDKLFSTIIYDSVKYKESIALNMPIHLHSSAYGIPYNKLVNEIKERMK